MSDSAILWTMAGQAPLSMGILWARILEWDLYIYIIGISSHNYVGQEDPQSVVCKLKIRKATGVIHSYSEGLRTRAANVVYSSPRPKVQELRS